MASFDAFYPKIMVDAVGVPPDVLDKYIRDTARDFCQRTLVWRSTLAAINTVANTAEYTLTPPAQASIAMLIHAIYTNADGVSKELKGPVSEDNLNATDPTWRVRAAGEPELCLTETRGSIRLVPKPNTSVTGGLTARVALKPSQAATSLDDTLLEHYEDVIVTGAKGHILMIQDKPWSDVERGHRFVKNYEEMMALIRRSARKSHTRAPLRVRPVSVP
jgi:hypothetical protein